MPRPLIGGGLTARTDASGMAANFMFKAPMMARALSVGGFRSSQGLKVSKKCSEYDGAAEYDRHGHKRDCSGDDHALQHLPRRRTAGAVRAGIQLRAGDRSDRKRCESPSRGG